MISILLLLSVPLLAPARTPTWGTVARPSAQPAQAYGGYAKGCLAGGVALPAAGDGFRSIRRHRNRYYGHPLLIAWVKRFAAEALEAGLPTLFVGDLSQPRGGRMPSGHRSHQIGLDVDIWFTQPAEVTREGDACFPSLVDTRAEVIDPTVFAPAHMEMVKRAAQSPAVARVFVNWVIKRELCATAGTDRGWLYKVRPWFGHNRHFHVRLACPPDNPQCRNQATPPLEDGCGQEAYFSRAAVRARKRAAKETPTKPPRRVTARAPFPRACQAVLEAPAK